MRSTTHKHVVTVLAGLLTSACALLVTPVVVSDPVSDAGTADLDGGDAGESVDAGESDAGSADAGFSDAGFADAGDTDAGSADAGPLCDGGPCPVEFQFEVTLNGNGACGDLPATLLLTFGWNPAEVPEPTCGSDANGAYCDYGYSPLIHATTTLKTNTLDYTNVFTSGAARVSAKYINFSAVNQPSSSPFLSVFLGGATEDLTITSLPTALDRAQFQNLSWYVQTDSELKECYVSGTISQVIQLSP